jgi:hypothetical protein
MPLSRNTFKKSQLAEKSIDTQDQKPIVYFQAIMHTIPSTSPAILAVQPISRNGRVEQIITQKYTTVSLHPAIES